MNKRAMKILACFVTCLLFVNCYGEKELEFKEITLSIPVPHSPNDAFFSMQGYIEGSSEIDLDIDSKVVNTLNAQLILTFPYPEVYFKQWNIPTENLNYNEIIEETQVALSESGNHVLSNILNITCTANLGVVSIKQFLNETEDYITIGAFVPCDENPQLLAMDLTIKIPIKKGKPAQVGIKLGRSVEVHGSEYGIKADPIILVSKDMINL